MMRILRELSSGRGRLLSSLFRFLLDQPVLGLFSIWELAIWQLVLYSADSRLATWLTSCLVRSVALVLLLTVLFLFFWFLAILLLLLPVRFLAISLLLLRVLSVGWLAVLALLFILLIAIAWLRLGAKLRVLGVASCHCEGIRLQIL